MIDLSIVIVNYNVKDFLIECIKSIKKSDIEDIATEIIVVDNASIDGSREGVLKNFPEVKWICNERNLGFAKANNQGFDIAKGKYILSLNPDTLVQEDTLKTSYQYMEAHTDCGVNGVMMLDGTGQYLQESKRGEPTLWNSFCKFSGLNFVFPNSKICNGYYLGHLDKNQIQEVNVLCGAYMFFRNDILKQTHGFDEDYFMYGEDIDLSMKINKMGFKVMYLPTTKIIHYKGESTRKASFNYVKNFYSAMLIYVNKHYTGINSWLQKLVIYTAISLFAILSYFKSNIKIHLAIIVDSILLYFFINLFKKLWGYVHFQNEYYFENTASFYNTIGLTIIFIHSIWFFGQYDKYWKLKRLIWGAISGLLASLTIYALLPSQWRSSRLILFATFSLAIILPLFTRYLRMWTGRIFQSSNPKFLVVCKTTNFEEIKNIIQNHFQPCEIIGIINPEQVQSDPYLNHLGNLTSTILNLKADYVVFSSSNLSLQDILSNMTLPENTVKYMIVNNSNDSIVTGNKNSKSTLLNLNAEYKLNIPVYQRLKRAFDIVSSILLLILSPIFAVKKNFRKNVFGNIFQVLVGIKTWVGYDSKESKLPKLRQSVFHYKNSLPNAIDQSDLHYARSFSFWMDLEILINNI